jgi:hypothetical protein
VDEAASGRAPSGMAMRDRSAGWQGSLVWEPGFIGCFGTPDHNTCAVLPSAARCAAWTILRSSRQLLNANNRHGVLAQPISDPSKLIAPIFARFIATDGVLASRRISLATSTTACAPQQTRRIRCGRLSQYASISVLPMSTLAVADPGRRHGRVPPLGRYP